MKYDTFLSHNSNDKPAVRELKRKLQEHQLTAWLDADELPPGIPWQRLVEDGIRHSSSVSVLIGKDGMGPWEDEEMQGALLMAVKDKRPVIPVLMPGAPSQPELPMFLGIRTWVDLRAGFTSDSIERLVWGITRAKPGSSALPSQNVLSIRPQRLWIEPTRNNNWVHFGTDKHENNSEYSISTRFHLMTGQLPVTLLGFVGQHYVDGCHSCPSRRPQFRLGQKTVEYSDDLFNFLEPHPIAASNVVMSSYFQSFRPPRMNMGAADCDLGDLEFHLRFRAGDELLEERLFFEFQPGGDLRKIEHEREVPRLNDSHLKELCAAGKLTNEQLKVLLEYPATCRYRAAYSDNRSEIYLGIPDHHRELLRSAPRG